MATTFSYNDLCRMLGRESPYVHNLQRQLELHLARKGEGYTEAYAIFMEQIVSLRALHVPMDDIKALFEIEKKVMCLLHADSLTDSPTWYLDNHTGRDREPRADELLLTGYRLGFPVESEQVQPTLDFAARDPELFKGHEMGEDIRLVLRKYRSLLGVVTARILREKPVVETALHWVKRTIL